MSGGVYTERGKGSALSDWLGENAQVLSIAVFFVACVVFFSAATTTFLSPNNLLNVVRQAAPILVVAVAMTFVIVTAGIDLSVGSLVALINAVAAIAIAAGLPWPVVVVAMLALGGLIGLAQGWFTAYQGIPAFIVTLAGLSILRGIALYLTEGYSIPIRDVPGFLWLGRGELAGIPVPAIIALGVAVLGYVVMSRTRYGRRVVAVGSNPEAARRVGMPAKGTIASVYAVSGVAAAVAGLPVRRAARLGVVERRGRVRAAGHRRGRARRHVPDGRARFDDRHPARHADHRGHRQRTDPDAHLAVLHPDRDRRDHPSRDLAQHAAVRAGERRVSAATVVTVTGEVSAASLGITLPHEHILNDCSCWWNAPTTPERTHLADRTIDLGILSELRQDPFVCRHNLALDDEALAIEELGAFAGAGGATVIDPTCRGIGRNPAALVRIARATGLNIVMGAGYYLQSSHPPELAAMSADDVAEQIEREARIGIAIGGEAMASGRSDEGRREGSGSSVGGDGGVGGGVGGVGGVGGDDGRGRGGSAVGNGNGNGNGGGGGGGGGGSTVGDDAERVRIGLIGEIGVSSDFTADERKSLVGAARAQVRTGLPLMVHLPGWFRLGHAVLDLVEAEGVDPRRVVLCHMNPSHADTDYQVALAQRGAFIEYDMIGMDYFYADQQVQCPSDDEAAFGIGRLCDAGFGDRVLLSQDVFLKMMLTRYGGNGYAFVQRHFLPRLRRHGFDEPSLERLTVHNPRSVFEPEFTGKTR